jgi:hypothetical protein
MVRYKTNILSSAESAFSEFRCYRSPLLITEADAWKRRYEYDSPMIPFGNSLYFTDKSLEITFINAEIIENVSLNPTEHSFLLQKLLHSALRILFEDRMFTRCKGVYITPRFMGDFNRLGTTYTIFKAVNPVVSFRNGQGLIKLVLGSKIFITRPPIPSEWVVTLCDLCSNKIRCSNVKHKISRVESVDGDNIRLGDIDGLRFVCQSRMVRIEARPEILRSEYGSILARTSVKTSEESQQVSAIVDMLSTNNAVIISFSEENRIPFHLLEG